MDYNNNRYLFVYASTLSAINEQHVISGSIAYARKNIAGTQWIVEVEPSSPYYNDPAAKTHQEALEIVAGAEWTADELP